MAKKKGRSEKKKDWLGRSYIQHYDSHDNKSGRSERKETFWGKKYTQHYGPSDTKRGRSERKETLLGRNYTQKYNSQGEKSGTSEKKTTFLGEKYTQHYDAKGNETDWSERKETWFGKQYIQRYGDDAPNKTSRSRSSRESSWSGYSNPEATSQLARTSQPIWLIVFSAILGFFLVGLVAESRSPFWLSVENHPNSLSGGGSADQAGKGTDVRGLKALFMGRELPPQRPQTMIVLEPDQQNSGFAFSDSDQLSYNGTLFTGVEFSSATKLAVSQISPDGIHALVVAFYPSDSRVIVLNLKSLIARELASSRGFFLWNAWSPNGTKVLFADAGEVDDSLHVADMSSMQESEINVALQVDQNTEMQHYVLADVHWATDDDIQIRKAVFCNVYERNACPDDYWSHPLRELTVMVDKFGSVNGHLQSTLSPASSIHSVNFDQFSYRVGFPYCGYFGDIVTVHDGEFRNNKASFEVSKVLYGDLTHEGGQQAVVWAVCAPNNEANPGADVSFAYVYDLRNDPPVLLATFANGWPWDYQGWTRAPEREDGMILWDITGTHVEARMLSFERFGAHARCCPEINLKRTFRWSNGRFVLARESETPWKEK